MSAASAIAPAPAAARDRIRQRSQLVVMAGLLLTFAGLVGYGLQLPVKPPLLDQVIPWLAVGFLTTWVGGILAGNSLNAPPPGVPAALRAQAGLGGLALVAGILSAVVVLRRLGPGAPVSSGGLTDLEVAIAGLALAWAGGFLMGKGMRRFVRRSRRRAAPAG